MISRGLPIAIALATALAIALAILAGLLIKKTPTPEYYIENIPMELDEIASYQVQLSVPMEAPSSPVEAYYAGRIEEAVQLLASADTGPEERHQLATLYWEMGENAKAAGLLEELTRNPYLAEAERDELLLELFITYVLMCGYEQAAALRSVMEPVLQRMNDRLRAEFYFYNALVYHEMGNLRSAEEFYRRSLDIYRWRAMAWYRLGTILLDRNPAEAETAFQNCWNQDRAFNAALLPLARLLAGRGEWLQARNLLITANERLPDDPAISAMLANVIRQIGPPSDGIHFIQRVIDAVPPTVSPAPITPGEGIMRIGLNVNRPLVSVKAGGDFSIRDAATRQLLYSGAALEQFWVEPDGDAGLRVRGGNNRVLLSSSSPVVFELHSERDTSIVAGVVSGAPGLNRTYRGHLEFRSEPRGITAVSIVSMGDYLYGVIPVEIPASWPMEVLRAQAIASRSYAMAYRGTFADRGFDIWNTALSQTYNGAGAEHRNSTIAVDDTRGIILVGEGDQPLAAYYSANHGGHSEDPLVVWGYDAYMQAVSDTLLPPRTSPLPPNELFRWLKDSPSTHSNVPGFFFDNTYRWERWVSPEEIRRRLIQDYRVGQDPGEIQKILTRGRGISGRIVELEIQGSEQTIHVRRNVIWAVTGGLRSSLFTIRYKLSPDGGIQHFVFQGGGYGHGIGMDQHAAGAQASRGMSAEEILRHYYPRASLRQL